MTTWNVRKCISRREVTSTPCFEKVIKIWAEKIGDRFLKIFIAKENKGHRITYFELSLPWGKSPATYFAFFFLTSQTSPMEPQQSGEKASQTI